MTSMVLVKYDIMIFGIFAVAAAATVAAMQPIDLQSRIDAAAEMDGGVVRVERGEWESKPFALKSGVTLELAEGAVVYASTTHADYAHKPRGERTFVSAVDAANAAICGKGVLDGRGWAFRESRRLPGWRWRSSTAGSGVR